MQKAEATNVKYAGGKCSKEKSAGERPSEHMQIEKTKQKWLQSGRVQGQRRDDKERR